MGREKEFERTALTKAVEGALAEQAKEGTELRVSTPGGRFRLSPE